MRRDVIAVRVRNKSERLRIPGIEPEILFRQINAALVPNFDHAGILRLNERRISNIAPLFAQRIDRAGQNRFHCAMKSVCHLVALFLCTACAAHVAEESQVLPKVQPLPMALSDDFEFRKIKLFSLGKTTSDATKSGTDA